MPIDDFRTQVDTTNLIYSLSLCALRYGVSLTAAILRWLEFTDENVILVVSRDEFMQWAFSSNSAFKNGAFFSTKKTVTSIPDGSLAANPLVVEEKNGEKIKATIWFQYADKEAYLTEYKIISEKYDQIITLIVLPKGLSVWKPREF